MGTKLKILLHEIVVPILIFFVISNYIIGSGAILAFWDKYRPDFGGITATTHVEKQMLHIESDSKLNKVDHKVLFVGSSSVVNGLDVTLVEKVWRENGIKAKPVNYGLTGFMAYELPFVKNVYLHANVEKVIFLYNTFCFSDVIHPQAASIRFNFFEFFRNGVWRKASFDQTTRGIFGQLFFIIRYRGVLRVIISRYLTGRLEEVKHSYDFIPGLVPKGKRQPYKEVPATGHWLREAYVTSDTMDETISYYGLNRFLDLTNTAGIQVVLGAIPVPDFAKNNKYRINVNHERIDRRVESIAKERNVAFIGRNEVRTLEQNDFLFWDRVHLHDNGRNIYSVWLASRLIPFFEKE